MDDKKTPNQIIESWAEEDWDRIGKSFKESMDKETAEDKTFYSSKRFEDIVVQISQELQEIRSMGCIHDNPYQEPLLGDVSNEEFIRVFCCLFNEEVSGLEPKEGMLGFFENTTVEFRGMVFKETYGQGTAFSVRSKE